jgi:hypothetical protein
MATQNPGRNQRFRVVGSGFTIFTYGGSQVNYCQEIQDRPPDPVAPPQAIQPIDETHPIEIAFPRAAGAGMLTLTIIDQWNLEVWRQFPGYSTGVINDIVDILTRSAQIGGVKLIKNPNGGTRAVNYHGAVITNVDMSEDVRIESMTVGKMVQIMYTNSTRQGG